MLILSRQREEKTFIVVPPSTVQRIVEVCVSDIRGDKVRLGFKADKDIAVHRGEVFAVAGNTPGPIRKD